MDPYGDTDLIVESDGMVWWVPPTNLRAECPLDVRYWPYDIQVCYLYLGSWTRHGYHMDIQLYRNVTSVRVNSIVIFISLFFFYIKSSQL